MKIKDLVTLIAEKEGKKSEVSVGDVREVLAVLSDLVFEKGDEVLEALVKNGKARAKRRAK